MKCSEFEEISSALVRDEAWMAPGNTPPVASVAHRN